MTDLKKPNETYKAPFSIERTCKIYVNDHKYDFDDDNCDPEGAMLNIYRRNRVEMEVPEPLLIHKDLKHLFAKKDRCIYKQITDTRNQI